MGVRAKSKDRRLQARDERITVLTMRSALVKGAS